MSAYTHKNAKYALDEDGDSSRYNGKFVVVHENGKVDINGSFSFNELNWISRFCGVRVEGAPSVSRPVSPSMIRFNIKGKKVLHILASGETYTLQNSKVA